VLLLGHTHDQGSQGLVDPGASWCLPLHRAIPFGATNSRSQARMVSALAIVAFSKRGWAHKLCENGVFEFFDQMG
jgi:hypothetical protein